MSGYVFYSVSHNGGMCGVESVDYSGLKAVFDNEPDAENHLLKLMIKYPDLEFTVEKVGVVVEE